MKMHAWTAASWLLLQFALNGCGLGTEVGNGVKPERDDEDSKKTSASQKSDPAEQQDAVNGQSDNVNMPEAADISPGEPGTYDFDINILLNSCGSPFESGYNGKINLTGKNSLGKINSVSGEYNYQTGTWLLKNTFAKFLATISDDDTSGDGIVEVFNADQVPFDSGYVCNKQAGSTENNISIFNFELIKGGKSTTLSWSVEDNGGDEKLLSISIKPGTAENNVIKLEAIK